MSPSRTLVIGDIHGALQSLVQVLDECGYDAEEDKIIFLGDYVDGWSEGAEVIDFLIDLQKGSKHGHIFIRGNHDKWTEEWLVYGRIHPYWLDNGGQSTMDSYINSELLIEESHRTFFKNLHNYYIDDKNRGFVHGGFISRKGIGHDSYSSDYYWDRDLWELSLMLDRQQQYLDEMSNKAKRMFKHKEVYIGHSATTNWKIKPHLKEYKDPKQKKSGLITVPMNRCNVWNVDTGCGWKGKLTIMDIDTKQYWQSEFSHLLYPNEKDR